MTKLFTSHRPKSAAKPRVKTGAKATGAPASGMGQARGPANETSQDKAKEIGKEIGGPEGPEPTRYGDWERKGICVDF